MEAIFKGSSLTIIHCKGAIESFNRALSTVTPSAKQTSLKTQMILQIDQLARGERLAGVHFRKEGSLPKKSGYFYALKRIPIRGYCWYSDRHKSTLYISHYIHKKTNGLDKIDERKVCNNWLRIEENGDEC